MYVVLLGLGTRFSPQRTVGTAAKISFFFFWLAYYKGKKCVLNFLSAEKFVSDNCYCE
jgi:hypothetical protein